MQYLPCQLLYIFYCILGTLDDAQELFLVVFKNHLVVKIEPSTLETKACFIIHWIITLVLYFCFYFHFRVKSGSARSLLLVLHSGVTCGRNWGTICCSTARIWISHIQGNPLYYLSSPGFRFFNSSIFIFFHGWKKIRAAFKNLFHLSGVFKSKKSRGQSGGATGKASAMQVVT